MYKSFLSCVILISTYLSSSRVVELEKRDLIFSLLKIQGRAKVSCEYKKYGVYSYIIIY